MTTQGQYRIMVDWAAEGIWGSDATEYIPDELLDKLHTWNWWWEMGLWNLERGRPLPDFNLEEFSRDGLRLAEEVKAACPRTKVYYYDEAAYELKEGLEDEFSSTIIPYWYEIVMEQDSSGSRFLSRGLPPGSLPWTDP